MKKIIDLLKKYIFNKEMILYLIMGVLTTVVNMVVYAICVKPLGILIHDKTIRIGTAKLIAWVIAVLFAFFTNKIWVFESKSWAPKVFWRELISFIGARALTGLLEVFGTPFLVSIGLDQTLFGVEGMWAVIIVSVFVIIFNYVFSKLVIFTHKGEDKK